MTFHDNLGSHSMKKLFLVIFLCVFSAVISFAYASDAPKKVKNKQYVFQNVGSPDYLAKENRILPAYEKLTFDLSGRYIFSGESTEEIESCRLNFSMMCVVVPSHGFFLYMPRREEMRTTWTYGDRTYIFEEWKHYPFAPTGSKLSAVHAFLTKSVEDRKKDGGVSYPTETYFIDKKTRLVGMIRYELSNPEHMGLNANYIASFYWVDGNGLPLSEF
jgi:hypothetical protein